MWPFRKKQVVAIPELRPPVPPAPKPEPIDPDYPRSEYRLVDNGAGEFFIEVQKPEDKEDYWYRLMWYDLSQVYESWWLKEGREVTMARVYAETFAKLHASHDYKMWKQKQAAGTIINLGKLP